MLQLHHCMLQGCSGKKYWYIHRVGLLLPHPRSNLNSEMLIFVKEETWSSRRKTTRSNGTRATLVEGNLVTAQR